MLVPNVPYLDVVQQTTSTEQQSMDLAVSQIGDGIWQLSIPYGTDSKAIEHTIAGTVFQHLDTEDCAIVDVDNTTFLYWSESYDERATLDDWPHAR